MNRTTNSEPLLESLRRELAADPQIRLAYLFGSSARDAAAADSDLDIAVSAGQPLSRDQRIALIDRLAALVGRPIDLVDLARAGLPILGQVLIHGRRILGGDDDHARLLVRYLFDAADFLPYRNRILEERRAAWIGRS
jgi:predicted nucleotidyltransferase